MVKYKRGMTLPLYITGKKTLQDYCTIQEIKDKDWTKPGTPWWSTDVTNDNHSKSPANIFAKNDILPHIRENKRNSFFFKKKLESKHTIHKYKIPVLDA